MKNKLAISFLTFIVCVIGWLIIPSPSSLFSAGRTEESSRKESIVLVSNEQNKGERCKEKTVYYTEENVYTADGEGVANPYCARLQGDLKKAVEESNIGIIKSLLAQGANANSPNDDYDLFYPIVTAIEKDNIDVIKLLLDNGADINHQVCRLADCRNILTTTVSYNRYETTKLLLERGADVNSIQRNDTEFYTAFGFALKNSNQKIPQLFENACEKSVLSRIKCRLTKLGHFLFE